MRIAMLTQRMLFGYGVDEVVDVLSRGMVSQGNEVVVITARKEIPSRCYQTLTIKPLPVPLATPYWQTYFLTDFRLVLPAIRTLEGFDIIVTFDPVHAIGAIAKLMLRTPIVMYYFGIVPPSVLDSIIRKIESLRQKLVWNASFAFADCILTNSKYTKEGLPKHLMRKASVNYQGIEHWIDDKASKGKEFREKLDIYDKKLILSVGRLSSPYKGMKDLITIFGRLRGITEDTTLLLAGRGSPRDVEKSSLLSGVLILPNVSNETLKLCFSSCDVYCSASKWEGFNIPLAAAQANGKPVVAYRVGAHREVVAHGKTGFLVETFQEFEECLKVLLEDDALREEMGKTAAEYAKKFTWASALERFKKTIEQASQL